MLFRGLRGYRGANDWPAAVVAAGRADVMRPHRTAAIFAFGQLNFGKTVMRPALIAFALGFALSGDAHI
jgi:hypothetical protein